MQKDGTVMRTWRTRSLSGSSDVVFYKQCRLLTSISFWICVYVCARIKRDRLCPYHGSTNLHHSRELHSDGSLLMNTLTGQEPDKEEKKKGSKRAKLWEEKSDELVHTYGIVHMNIFTHDNDFMDFLFWTKAAVQSIRNQIYSSLGERSIKD